MLVVDASAIAELVLESPRARWVSAALAEHGADGLLAPHVVDAEVIGIIRREHLSGSVDGTRADAAVRMLASWPAERIPHVPLLPRAWELRSNVRSWDAFYVALAEAVDAPLLTLDARLARADGPRCRFIVP